MERKNNVLEFPKINDRHQTTDPGSSENIKQNKHQKYLYLGKLYSNYRKTKTKYLKKARVEGKFTSRGNGTGTTVDFSSKTMQARSEWDELF